MKTIKIWNDSPSDRQLNEIVRDLENGMTMIWPTDTIYGIACDALNVKGIEKICRLKGINPEKTNLSIVCSSISMAAEYARFSDNIYRLLKQNTPGPFTFLCRTSSALPRAFRGRKTVGIRIPDCKTDLEIVERLGHPVLTTSVEVDDEDYAIQPELLAEKYHDKIDIILEGEPGGIEPSTMVDCTGDEVEIIRQGAGNLQ